MKNYKSQQKIENSPKSDWSKQADFRLKNRKWLRYSSQIARRVLAALEDSKEFKNQKELAKNINVSPQQVSKILKGQQNLTLETIAKLSTALNIELISFPEYKYSEAIVADTPEIVENIVKVQREAIGENKYRYFFTSLEKLKETAPVNTQTIEIASDSPTLYLQERA